MNAISDQILAIAKDMHTRDYLDGAGRLRVIAAQVRRMETALNELVDEAMQEANTPIAIHFPPQSRMRP
jgi:hypothetical protein